MMLAGEVIKLAARLNDPTYPICPAKVTVTSERIDLPARELPPEGPVRDAFEAADRALAKAETEEERKRLARDRRVAEEALIQIQRLREPLEGELQVLRLGDVAIVGLPGEPFSAIGLEIKERAAVPHPFVVGYANDYLGYFPTPRAWEQGGYEMSNGPWSLAGPAAAAVLVEKALELIEALWEARTCL